MILLVNEQKGKIAHLKFSIAKRALIFNFRVIHSNFQEIFA